MMANVATVIGIGLAVYTYRENGRLQKTKWISELHTKFYQEKTYKEIRKYLDYQTEEYHKLVRCITDDNIPDEQEKLVNYLNFFEFIATLKKVGQLDLRDINYVFGYYINLLNERDEIKKFVLRSGFQNLPDLMKNISPLRNK